MKVKAFLRETRKLIEDYRVASDKGFRLRDFDPDDTREFEPDNRDRCQELLAAGLELITE